MNRIKTWIFNRSFNSYYKNLLRGELYGIKVKLLSDMGENRQQYLQEYLENGTPVSKQLIKKVNILK